jgi:hypothetical protein
VDGEPVPRGYTVEFSETDSAAKARTIGFVSLGAGYTAAYVSAVSLPGELSWLFAPVVGPWVVVADESKPKRGLIALDGAVQLVGFVLLVGGIIGGGHQIVRDDDRSEVVEAVSVAPTTFGDGGYGLGMCGAF